MKKQEHILLKIQSGESIVSMGSDHSSFYDHSWFSSEENGELFELDGFGVEGTPLI